MVKLSLSSWHCAVGLLKITLYTCGEEIIIPIVKISSIIPLVVRPKEEIYLIVEVC